ncbi:MULTISPECIES: SsrA-binding protein SmpB [Prochlorococcus]|uniref:SsrA-binding protein n=1 Tax=Prochlorococcus marinus (strain SARG / CCMP1375 / SS120) TaxID=167539 RepID=SSRP_PROMA|nr:MULTISPECIES: SsrA-binding protein SmpB [Prochlorococcus]Q7V9Q3.1 RecName: Full=SsrA-binding protein; AltName: Full=Small protein B [Prochlorococcus marinus subsp. marinus str. CCMP1375]AAQ00820.1 tmRNA-binding protein [Prochlorococcus marinus subsp. marinus str. CCMP1375]KGG10685.1 tmRNA-binding protein SmpB [Prochlorococcus marinus str. LG]KGG21106.1 tmRNA-binding protein SmpB [Prochlorococcus marinus str. SS2]KGG23931.1 tmRNA-binding protein SmpB [Prochlorococcus marinus str. SS35]KGG31
MSKARNNKKSKLSKAKSNRRLAENRYARHQYEILEDIEAGIELLGTEVKSIRAGNVNLRDGFCLIREGSLLLHNVHISPFNNAGSFFNHEPLRVRKLLAHRKEINKLETQVNRKGLTLVPLNIFLKGSWIKITIGLGKGRKLHDKRENEKRKQSEREVKSALARY